MEYNHGEMNIKQFRSFITANKFSSLTKLVWQYNTKTYTLWNPDVVKTEDSGTKEDGTILIGANGAGKS